MSSGGVSASSNVFASMRSETVTAVDNSIIVNGAGLYDASAGDIQFNVTAGDYFYTIASFGKGDVLHFPAGSSTAVVNSNPLMV
jgi:hypothetical protein